jgi:hypothetical protein
MSRGPGRIERAIEEIIAAEPDEAFTVEELCKRIYGFKYGSSVERKHRVTVSRAGKSMIERGGNCGAMGWGGRSKALVFYTPDNLMSYALAYMKSSGYGGAGATDSWLRERLAYEDLQKNMVPGGRWWLRVELLKAERTGDTDRVAELGGAIEGESKIAQAKAAALMRMAAG